MRIALMHFHLKTGGVTTVIKRQAAWLRASGHDVLLVVGETTEKAMPAPVVVVPGLRYDQEHTRAITPDACAAEILGHIKHHWQGNPADVIHVHNPTLAKTRRLQAVLKRLQQAGMRLLCQIHDFAEDGRPDVYFHEAYIGDCHYAVLNQRDRQLLCRAGLLEQGVHYLPNPVIPLPASIKPKPAAGHTMLYPARAIRRKNIGEAILLTMYASPPAALAITLPPNSQRDMPGYHAWQEMVRQHNLPVLFETGLKYDLPRQVASSRFVLTTSITEGFGFAFLEPWTADKALWGRLLPDVCQDFTTNDMHLSHLYSRFLVPLTWMDSDLLRRKWRQALRYAYSRYALAWDADEIEAQWRAVTQDNLIDFGKLSEPFQQQVILKVLHDAAAFQTLMQINPFLEDPGPPRPYDELIRHNKAIVMERYASNQYGCRLLEIYTKVMDYSVRQSIRKGVLLNFFLTPERFSLLKWSGHDT